LGYLETRALVRLGAASRSRSERFSGRTPKSSRRSRLGRSAIGFNDSTIVTFPEESQLGSRREAHRSQSPQSAERGEVRDLGKMDEAQILQPNQTGDWFEIGVWVSSHHKRPNVWVAMQLRQ
jgi:hypothetical protein